MRIGIDLVRDARIDSTDEFFVKKILLPSEYVFRSKLPTIFALKEAALKALGEPPGWHRIRVEYCSGVPYVHVQGCTTICSVSHEHGMTVAVVVLHEEQ